MEAIFTGRAFKQLMSEVTKFPSVGTFAGSELINLRQGWHWRGEGQGLVLAWSEVPAEGQLVCSADERVLTTFAGLFRDSAKVKVDLVGEGGGGGGGGTVSKTGTSKDGSRQAYKKPAMDGEPLAITADAGRNLQSFRGGFRFRIQAGIVLCDVGLWITGD